MARTSSIGSSGTIRRPHKDSDDVFDGVRWRWMKDFLHKNDALTAAGVAKALGYRTKVRQVNIVYSKHRTTGLAYALYVLKR